MLKLNRVDSFGSNRKKGVTIIYNSSNFDQTLEYLSDDDGRICLLVVSRDEQIYIFVNFYAPNDHSINFFVDLSDLLHRTKSKYPGSEIIVGGDFNLVLNSKINSTNRKQSSTEVNSAEYIIKQSYILGIKDIFRLNNNLSFGNTWKGRGIESRIHLFLVSVLTASKSCYCVDNCFTSTDHVAISLQFDIKTSPRFGPGIRFVDGEALKDPFCKNKIINDILRELESTPSKWDPNIKWDYTKMIARQVLNRFKGKNFNQLENSVVYLEAEINRAIKYNDQFHISEVENSINSLKADLESARIDFAKFLAVRSRATYYEKGEKSTKYFLNQMKEKRKRTFIDTIEGRDGIIRTKPNEIKDEIFNFYKDLYSKQKIECNYDSPMFNNLPQVKDEDNLLLVSDIGPIEISSFLKKCKSTSPGQDGLHYEIYRELWPVFEAPLIDSWKYSLVKGSLSDSQRRTTITLIDKKGKDKTKLKNLRPIALANCDLKIFTKILARRLDGALSRIIHPSQKAYIKGRNIHDNLRFIDLWKSYCKRNSIDGAIVALDARKAFDSVDHCYLFMILKKYGFSDSFVNIIMMLYKNLESNVMVNGYTTNNFNLEQCVKQGDALSCGLFIICIDPLIRYLNNNVNIRAIVFESPFTHNKTSNKTQGFADDITVTTLNDRKSINSIFEDYENFSKASGIFLNADKTEILTTRGESSNFEIKYCNETFNIVSVNRLTVCGRVYSNLEEIENESNVQSKILKLEKQVNIWSQRDLSIEGKIVIVKTFGLSQVIYSMQNYFFSHSQLREIEKIIYKFIWSKRGKVGVERIKRNILKNNYEMGGLKAPDLQAIDLSLKTKYFLDNIKKEDSDIGIVTDCILYEANNFERRAYFYNGDSLSDNFIKKSVEGINRIFSYFESDLEINLGINRLTRRYADCISTINLGNYIAFDQLGTNNIRKMYNKGFNTFNFMYNCIKFSSSENYILRNETLRGALPPLWFNTLDHFNNFNMLIAPLEYITTDVNKFKRLEKIKNKNLREMFTYRHCESADFEKIKNEYNINNIPDKVFKYSRDFTVSSKLRNTQFLFLHRDIYSKSKLFKFGIVDNPLCDRCLKNKIECIENISHLLFDCPQSIVCWNITGNIISKLINEKIELDKSKILFGLIYESTIKL